MKAQFNVVNVCEYIALANAKPTTHGVQLSAPLSSAA